MRLLGSGFLHTGESVVVVRMRSVEGGSVERRVPAAFISESEMRFMAPEFQEAGDAQVGLALNGQQDDAEQEVVFEYKAPAAMCSLQ